MKKNKNWLLVGGVVLLVVAAVLIVNSAGPHPSRRNTPIPANRATTTTQTPKPHDHSKGTSTKPVPAYLAQAPSKASLGPTLEPEKFTGLTREAYRAVKQIPTTIAQLPCYCHCDEGFGHKSLYSCFEDDHASHCAVCVNEALLALRLEREEKLTPAQIRQRIVAQYENQ
jgi:hypothetical protein